MKRYSQKEVLSIMCKSCLCIIVCVILGGALFGIYAKHKHQTYFTAQRNVLISHNVNKSAQSSDDSNGNNLTNADLNMMPTYEKIAENDIIARQARIYLPSKLKKKYSVNDIQNNVKAKSHPQSLILEINVKTEKAQDSVEIVNATAKALKVELPKIQSGAGKVTLLAKANKQNATSETKPHAKKYALAGAILGGLIGLIASFGVITVKSFND